MNHKKIKHSMAFVAAALMVCQPITASAVAFADMNLAPWAGAETSINRAADLGLVVGEVKNGKNYFRPRDSVSLSEVCQLAYKLLIQTGKATADSSISEKWTSVMKTYGIQEWAYPAVSFCLENKIITITNLNSFIKNNANMPATREQAVTILGRTLTTGVPTYTANASTTIFNDNSSISSEAKPYVALLNQVGVVNGDAGKFNPKSTLNRTETAVLVTNLYTVLGNAATVTPPSSSSTKSGTVSDLNSIYVNFKDSDAYYFFATGASATLNGKASSISELSTLFKNGITITADLTLSGTRITKIEAKADTKTVENALTGTIKSLSKTVIKIGSNEYDIDDYKTLIIKINGSTKEYEDLKALFDDEETITATLTLDKDNYVTRIDATTKSSSSSSKNKLTEIKEVSGKDYDAYITVGSDKYYIEDVDDITITLDKKSIDFDDLVDAYKDLDKDEYISVSVTLDKSDDDYITKIVATTKDTDDDDDDDDEKDGSKKGIIKSLSSSKIKIGSTSYTIKSTSSLDIDIDDGDETIDDWDELEEAYDDRKEMEVTVTVTSGKVTKIKGEVVKVEGTYYKCNEDEIKVKTDSGSYTYNLDDDWDEISAKLTGDSSVKTLEDLANVADDDEDDIIVTLTLKDGKVTKVSAEWED